MPKLQDRIKNWQQEHRLRRARKMHRWYEHRVITAFRPLAEALGATGLVLLAAAPLFFILLGMWLLSGNGGVMIKADRLTPATGRPNALIWHKKGGRKIILVDALFQPCPGQPLGKYQQRTNQALAEAHWVRFQPIKVPPVQGVVMGRIWLDGQRLATMVAQSGPAALVLVPDKPCTADPDAGKSTEEKINEEMAD